ncbi:MAG: hypothetical protein ABW131_04425 [Candidatus Sedimenticola sp. 6PFRAG5]
MDPRFTIHKTGGLILGSSILMLSVVLSGCASMAQSQPPLKAIEDAHLFGVTRLEFNPTGEKIASAGFRGDLAIWSVPDGSPTLQMKLYRQPVRGLAWVDQVRLITASESGGLRVVDTLRSKVVSRMQAGGRLTALAYSPRYRRIYTGHGNGQVNAYSYPDLELTNSYRLSGELLALALSEDGSSIAVSNDSGRVVLLDRRLDLLRELEQPDNDAVSLRFSPDGRELAAGAWYELYYWDLNTGRIRQQDTEHWGAVISIDYSPVEPHLVSIGRHSDANIRLILPTTGEVVRRLQVHRLCGAVVRFSPNGRYIASGSDDASIRFYDLNGYNPEK